MSTQTVVDVIVSGTTTTVVDKRVDGITTVAGASPITEVTGQRPDLGVKTCLLGGEGDILSLTNDIAQVRANLIVTGTTLTDEIGVLSGHLITTGNNLEFQLSTLSGNLIASGNSLDSLRDILSGNLITTGNTLQNIITGATGDISTITQNLISTGNNLQNQILNSGDITDDISGNLITTGQTLTNNLISTGNALQPQIDTIESNLTITGQTLLTTGANLQTLIVNNTNNLIDTGNNLEPRINTNVANISTLNTATGVLSTATGELQEYKFSKSGGTISGSILPSSSGSLNLGSPSLTFQTGYFDDLEVGSNTLFIGGVPIKSINGGINFFDATGTTTFRDVSIRNLTVTGTETIIDVEHLAVKDNIIIINSGESGAGIGVRSGGLVIDRGTLPAADFLFNENTDRFEFNFPLAVDGNVVVTQNQTGAYASASDLIQTGVTLQNQITSNDTDIASLEVATGELKTQSNATDSNLITTGQTLTSEIAIVSGIAGGSTFDALSGNLITTGQTLTSEIAIVSGMAGGSDLATLSGNLITTGQTLQTQITSNDSDISTLTSNLVITGSRIDSVSGNLITTGQTLQTQISSNDSDIVTLTSNLRQTGVNVTNLLIETGFAILDTSGNANTISGNLISTGKYLTDEIATVSGMATGGAAADIISGDLITTGQTLTSEIGIVSGLTVTNTNNLISTGNNLQGQITSNDGQIAGIIGDLVSTGQTLTTNINSVSSNLITTGQTLTSEIAIVSGIATGGSAQDFRELSGNLITTGQTLQTQITSNDGDITNLTSNLITTGQTLTSEIAIVSGLTTGSSSDPDLSGKVDTLSGNLITTGQYLTDEIAIVSGLAGGGDIDTLSGNLITTGQTLTTNINTVSSNLVSTGSRVDDISGNLITTGQTLQTQITSNDSDITNLTSNLITTGQTLTTDVNTVSGLITDNDADITALKSATGVLKTSTDNNTTNLITTGSVIDDVSGNLITTGQTLQTQITSNDNDISNITSNLVTTGQTLQTQITSNDSDISTLTSNLVTTGQTLTSEIAIVSGIATGGSEQDFRELSGNLITTGQTLQTQITSNDSDISTLTSNLVTTGQTLTTNVNTVSSNLVSTGKVIDDVSGNLITTGQTLQTQITSNDGDITTLTSNLVTTGQTLTTNINTVSTNLVSTGKVIDDVSGNLITTGQTLQTQITSNDGDISTLTSNLVTTGQTLTTNVNTVSSNLISTGAVVDDISGNLGTTGQTLQTQITANDSDITTLTSNLITTGNTLDTTTVKLTTNQSVAGNKIFTDTVTINNLTVTGTEVIVDVENLAVKDNIIEINSGESGAGISRISGGITIDRGSATNANILYNDANDRFELNFPLAVEGSLVASAANLISTGAVVDDISGNLITTGQTLTTNINTVANNLGTSGQTLQTQITTLEGQTGDYLTEESVSGTYSTQFNVSVANDGGGNKYYLSDVTGPSYTATTQVKQLEVYLNRGETYKFTTDSSTSNHPFFFATQGNGGSYTHEYTSGITNSRSQNGGILYFRVPQSAPDTLYYNCGFHAGMGAEAKIYDNTGILASSSNLISTGAALQTQITSNDADISTLTSNLVSTGSVVDDISGNLITTGQTLQTQITSNDADVTTLTSNLVTTGQTLTTNINTVSTNLISTGKVVDDISGNLITTGQTLQTQITSNDADITTLTSNLITTGQTLQTQITSNDTDITNLSSNLVTTGQTLTTNINTVATNLVTTGQTLTSEIATVSGLIPATVIDGGGTANTVPLWSDANTIGDSVISQSSSKIGIGIVSPTAQLHIKGSDTTDQVVIENTDASSTSAPDLILYRNSTSPAASDNIGLIQFRGRNDNSQDVNYASILANAVDETDTTEDTKLSFYTYVAGTETESVVIKSGNVGIGNAAPAFKLQVNGDVRINSGTAFLDDGQSIRWGGTAAKIDGSSGGDYLRFYTDGAERVRIISGGAVGVGTATPNAGSWSNAVTIQGASSVGLELMKGSSLYAFMGVQGSGSGHALDIAAYQNQSIRLRVGSNAGTTALTISNTGAFTFSGGITVGADDTGYDVRLYGATSGRYWEWDESMDLVRMRDNVKTVFGNGDDLQIYHNGSHSYIDGTNTGDLYIRSTSDDVVIQGADDVFIYTQGGEDAIIARGDAGVDLFHDNVKKFETTATGATVSGGLTVNDSDGRSTVTLIGAKTANGNFADIYGSNNSDAGRAQISFRRDDNDDAAAILFYTEATGSSMAEAVRINSAGCVGIGTAAPADTLHVYGAGTTAIFQSSSANGYISIKETSGGNHVYLGNQSGEFVIQTPGSSYSTKFQVTSVGLVGIGISPTTRLQVKDSVDNSYESGISIVRSADGATTWLNVRGGATNFNNKNNAGNAGLPYRWYQNGTERLKIESSGAVTFNTAFTFPTADGSAGQVLQTNGSGTVTWATVSGGGGVSGSGTDHYIPRWNGTTALQDSSIIALDSGVVGIGTNAPNAAGASTNNSILSLKGKATAYGGILELINYGTSGNGQSHGVIRFLDNTTENAQIEVLRHSAADDARMDFKTRATGGSLTTRLTIAADGNVGIGTNAPAAKLEVQGLEVKIGAASPTSAAHYLRIKYDNSEGIIDSNRGKLKLQSNEDIVYTLDNFGINVASPGYKLDVEESSGNEIARFQGANSGSITFRNAASNVFRIYAGGSDSLGFAAGNSFNADHLTINASGTITFNNAFTFPTSDGSAGQVLQTNGSGTVTWATVSGGGGVSGSGTDNYIPRWNGTTALQDSSVIALDSGSVGIGTATPTGRLTIKSSGNSSYALEVQSSLDADKIFGVYQDGDGDGALYVFNKDATSTVGLSSVGNSWLTGGNFGIGTNSPSADLHIGSAFSDATNDLSSPALAIKQTGLGVEQGIYLERGGERKGYYIGMAGLDGLAFQRNFAGTKSVVMTLDRTGNVGIGTDSTAYRLEVKGSVTGDWLSRIYNTATTSNPSGLLVRIDDADSTGMILGVNNNGTYHMVVKGDGNVGIGTNAPDTKLHIEGVTKTSATVESTSNHAELIIKSENNTYSPYVVFKDAGADRYFIQANPSDSLLFRPQGTGTVSNWVVFSSNGSVGIGTDAPDGKLHVTNTTYIDVATNTGTASALIWRRLDKTIVGRIVADTTNLKTQIWDNNSAVVTIGSDQVGIGTDAPTRLLTLENNTGTVVNQSQLRINNAGAGDSYIYMYAGADWSFGIDNSDADKFKFNISNDVSDGTEVLTLQRDGSVGIGTNAPAQMLSVFQGRIGVTDGYQIGDMTGNTGMIVYGGSRIVWEVGGSEKMRVNSSGSVGIGTATPGSNTPLHIYTNSASDQTILLDNDSSGQTGLTLRTDRNSDGNAANFIYFDAADDGGNNTRYATIESFIVDNTNGTEDGALRFSVMAGGNDRESMTISARSGVSDIGFVGIGSNAPTFPLQVYGANQTNGSAKRIVAFFDTTSAAAGTGAGIALGGYTNGTSGGINDFGVIQGIKENGTAGNYASALTFHTRANGANTVERMRLSSDGKLLINATSPTLNTGSTLYVNGNAYASEFELPSGGKLDWANGDATIEEGLTSNYSLSLRNYDGSSAMVTTMFLKSGGNVGIGTVAPAAHLHVSKAVGTTTVLTQVAANSTVGYEIKKTGSTTQHWKIVDGQTANGYLEIYDATDSATRMAFNTAGNVGIGTVNAPHLLTIKGDDKYFAAYASDGSIAAQLGSDSSGDGNFVLYDHSGGTKVKLYAESGGANYINNGGNLGIGTNNPSAAYGPVLHIRGTNPVLRLDGTGANSWAWITMNTATASEGRAMGLGADGSFRVTANSASMDANIQLHITQAGAVTFNSAFTFPNADGSAGQVLQTNGSGTVTWATVSGGGGVSGSGTDHYIPRWNGTTALQDSSIIALDNGHVGIGTATPGARLDINGTVYFRSTSVKGVISCPSSDIFDIANASGGSSNPITFSTQGSERVRIDHTGNVGIGTNAPLDKLDVYGTGAIFRNLSDDADSVQIVRGTNHTASPDAKFYIYDNSSADWAAKINLDGASYGLDITGGVNYFLLCRDASGNRMFEVHNTSVVVNDGSTDMDFRVEGNGDDYLLFTDGGNDRVAISTNTPAAKLHVEGDFKVGASNNGNWMGYKDVAMNGSSYTTALTINLANHTACHVKLFLSGDWSGHSAVAFVGEYFIQNSADGYQEPGQIISEFDNTNTDLIMSKIVDPSSDTFTIQLKLSTTANGSFTGKLSYHVMGMATAVS